MKTKRIFSKTMAEYLVDGGCNLLRLAPDIIDSTRIVWVFEDTPLLQSRMSEYTQGLRRK